MKLYFAVSNFPWEPQRYHYAAEQMMLTLFPGERPEYPEEDPPREMDREDNAVIFTLHRGKKLTNVSVLVFRAPGWYNGVTRFPSEKLDEAPEAVYHTVQHALKLAFYKAGTALLGYEPPWGALTGVRPVKLPTRALLAGATPKQAQKELEKEYHVSPERARLAVDCAQASVAARQSLQEDEVSLYIGIPFCPTRCAYCSFVSQSVEKSMKLMDPFFNALLLEVEATARQVRQLGLEPVSLYMGGGTPTTLSAEQLDVLFSRLETEFDLSRLRENTVEAGRPDTITREKLEVLKRHGVTRVSVNPQTMEDSVLEAIGRKHTARDILDALALVRDVGGMAVNMDLIAGLPTDTPEGFARTLNTVLDLAPENVTVHTLSLKKGARLKDEGGDIPAPADVAAMLDFAFPKLREAGFRPYYLYRQKNMAGGFENTGWTLPGQENLYNICIMEELCSIIAMGAGGSTKLTAPGGKIQRIFAPKYPNEYIANIEKTCSDKNKIGEFYGISTQ